MGILAVQRVAEQRQEEPKAVGSRSAETKRSWLECSLRWPGDGEARQSHRGRTDRWQQRERGGAA